jgi:long-chain acyl-CoA synthetase
MAGVTSRIPAHADARPERPALRVGDDVLTWGELAAALDRLAAHVAACVPAGGGVALHLPTGPALALLVLAVAHAGREAQVLDPDWPAATVDAVLDALAPALLVTGSPHRGGPKAIRLDDHLPFAAVADAVGAPLRYQRPAEPADRSRFYVGFTSGSTGRPKGYGRDHRSWTESFAGDAVEFGIGPQDVVVAPGTLTHSLFLYALMQGLHAGATVILSTGFRPASVLRQVRTHEATVLYGVPTHLRLVLEAAAGHAPCPSLRWILSSGAKWAADALPALRRAFPNARFAEFYGASELSFVTVAKDGEPVPPGSVGRAFHGVDLTVRDRLGRRLPRGRTGLDFVDSPLVFSGYVLADGDDVLRAGQAMSVGDVGHLDADGYLHLVGRARRMIVAAGRNVHPEAVERVLEAHPAVATAGVFGVADAVRGERLAALVSLRSGQAATAAGLIAHARALLPPYKVPRRYGVVRDWPLTPSGKTDFAALQDRWAAGAYEPLP